MKGKLKKLFVNHGEKIGMAVVAVVVLLGLAKADWAPYTGTPGEITNKVKQAQAKWEPATWPAEEAQQFEIKPEDEPKAIVATHIGNAMPLSEFMLTQKFSRSPYEQTKPLTNPDWIPPEDPIATPGRVLLAVIDEEARKEAELRMQGLDKDGNKLPPGTFPGAPKPVDENIPDEFRSRITPGLTGTQGDGLAVDQSQFAPDSLSMITPGRNRRGQRGAAALPPGAEGLLGDPALAGMGEAGMGMGMGMGAGLPYGQKGRGFHYVAVRAVFPVREQLYKIIEATNIPQQQAAMALEILDYRIERQTKQESGDPWGGPWEPVDVNVSTDVLTKMSVGLEPDVIFPQLTDPAMTMPLPTRISGVWRRDVTHPRIEEFTLTDEQIQQEVMLQQEALRKLEELQKELPPPPAQKAGWSQLVISGSQLQNFMMGGDGSAGYGGMGGMGFALPNATGESDAGYGGGAMGGGAFTGGAFGAAGMPGVPGGNKPAPKLKPIDELLKMKDKELAKELKDYVAKAVNVVGELLLFRYIDFSVEPGKTYRYRVALVFRNPNFNRNADEAAGDTSVVSGETRTSDWSKPTLPATVPKDQQSYVTDVRPAGNSAFPTPYLNVFQWDPNLGSIQNQVLQVQLGQTISGNKLTDVLDPAKASFEVKNYTFQSTDYVIDAQPDVQLEPAAHPEVKATGGTNHLGLPEQVLVALSEGGVSILDPSVTRQAEVESKKYLELQNKTWKEMKDAAKMQTEAFAGMEGSEGMEGMYDSMMYNTRGFSPLSTRGGRRPRGGMAPARD